MYSKINAMALFGMEGVLIRVECDASSGLPEMSMVGFLGAEVKEAKERVRTALKNTGFTLPPHLGHTCTPSEPKMNFSS